MLLHSIIPSLTLHHVLIYRSKQIYTHHYPHKRINNLQELILFSFERKTKAEHPL